MPTLQKLSDENIRGSFIELEAVVNAIDDDNLNLPWSQWQPTLGANSSMTFTATTIETARYVQIDKTIHFFIYVTGTVGGTPSTALTFTLPLRPRDGQLPNFTAIAIDNSSEVCGFARTSAAQSDIINVKRYDGANYTAGSSGFFVSGTYEVA